MESGPRFPDPTTIATKKNPNTTKYSDHRTVGLIADFAKIVASIFGRKAERKIGDVLGEDAFEFRRGKDYPKT